MKEITGDIWNVAKTIAGSTTLCITTNGVVGVDGAIMGKGIAMEARERYPDLPKLLGRKLEKHGNHVFHFPDKTLFTFPTKNHWRDDAVPDLIVQSALELRHFVDYTDSIYLHKIFLPRPGCGNGGLDWEKQVKPLIKDILDDRFIIISK